MLKATRNKTGKATEPKSVAFFIRCILLRNITSIDVISRGALTLRVDLIESLK